MQKTNIAGGGTASNQEKAAGNAQERDLAKQLSTYADGFTAFSFVQGATFCSLLAQNAAVACDATSPDAEQEKACHCASVASALQRGLHRLRAGHWLHRVSWNGNRRVEYPASPVEGAGVFHAACLLRMDAHGDWRTVVRSCHCV